MKHLVVAFLSVIISTFTHGQGGSAIAPKYLFDPSRPDAVQIAPETESVSVAPENGGLSVRVAPGPDGYPGFVIKPAGDKNWDLSPWGRVQARVTNTGKGKIGVNMRVDNDGPWQDNPWNCESVWLDPGESKELKVIFGYQYGFKPGYKLKPEAVVRLLFFISKTNEEKSFRLEDIQATGSAGEKPPVDPDSVVTIPENGVMLAPGLQNKPRVEAKNGAKATMGADNVVRIDVPAGKDGAVIIGPKTGTWNLNRHHQVKVKLRNSGGVALTPGVCVESRGGPTDRADAAEPLAPGAETELTASFIPRKPWAGVTEIKGTYNGGMPGTGSSFENTRVKGVAVYTGKPDADASLEVLSVTGAAPPAQIPAWVGTRPPVDGDWKMTLDENFDGSSINLATWNIYTHNYWDKRTHFTRENNIVKDGRLILRYEKKTGFHNDDPDDKKTVGKTDFACGFASTYGKWTQRYGYFEARMKLPTCPGLWPAFWMMPDRGKQLGEDWKRSDTGNGGMEYDIMEHLTAWGPYRFNMALHWDGYGKEHRSVGTSNAYVPADADGFRTIGMLWTPGEVVFYGNGEEIGRWKNERVSDKQSYIILYMVSGGWANVPLDESCLPDGFVIDYVRVWQRGDLATPADGPKPNDGGPRMMF